MYIIKNQKIKYVINTMPDFLFVKHSVKINKSNERKNTSLARQTISAGCNI